MKQQLDAFIEKHSKARAIQIDKKYDKNQISVFENANRSYVKGAELLKPMLIEALEQLEKCVEIEDQLKIIGRAVVSPSREVLEKIKAQIGASDEQTN